jgi:type 1 glutamine amidotransferase
LRDAPFSLESPLVDVLLSPAAKAVVAGADGKTLAMMPGPWQRTTAPTFAAILALRQALAFTDEPPAALPALDAALRALPVTRADKVARCARYDAVVPRLQLPAGRGPRLLVFEKINGFRDTPSVNAAHAALVDMAAQHGWRLVFTDKGGAFNPRTLARFDAVIWNNVSGDVLTLSQRRAFRHYITNGGGFVGFHGSAGDPAWFWDWYPDVLIGARFAGHPTQPQFQEARIVVDKAHPLAAALPAEWRMTDEWYSFKTNPRAVGAKVLLTLDESTYTRVSLFKEPLDMGDHPLAWTHCVGKGRVFYSAIGHLPATYSQPQNRAMLEQAIGWAATARTECRR